MQSLGAEADIVDTMTTIVMTTTTTTNGQLLLLLGLLLGLNVEYLDAGWDDKICIVGSISEKFCQIVTQWIKYSKYKAHCEQERHKYIDIANF